MFSNIFVGDGAHDVPYMNRTLSFLNGLSDWNQTTNGRHTKFTVYFLECAGSIFIVYVAFFIEILVWFVFV